LPDKIIRDLGLNLELRRRNIASFTPYERDGKHEGLLLSNVCEATSRASMERLTGNGSEYENLQRFYSLGNRFAEAVWDTMLEPLVARETMEQRVGKDALGREAWRSLAEEPLGHAVERYVTDDLVRGVVFTDAKIGLLTRPDDPRLLQNRCFLYHVIGNKTGEWKVPVGGMGRVAGELERVARENGAEIAVRADLKSVQLSADAQTVTFSLDETDQVVESRYLLVNFGRNTLARFTGHSWQPTSEDEGTAFKVNMLLRRLPKLKASGHDARDAFSGTFHCDEGYEAMKQSYAEAAAGRLPEQPPGEVYCHTLTDDSILSPALRAEGYQTLTLFGLDAAWSAFATNPAETRTEAERRYLAGLNRWLAEPLEGCLATAADGTPCVESKSAIDLENTLGMVRGNIFHGALTFPFAETPEQIGTWGVETEFENVFFCGSAARRGGAVSGIPGHNAARKVLENLAKR
jgi:phytoene dehydrogenase-like protein